MSGEILITTMEVEETGGAAEMGSRIHDSRYHRIFDLSSKNKVFILNKLGIVSNGRVRERKQRGRAHWGRGTSKNKVFILSELRTRSNGRAK